MFDVYADNSAMWLQVICTAPEEEDTPGELDDFDVDPVL